MRYYPKEYALRELTQLYSFTGLQIIHNSSELELNQNTNKIRIRKQFNNKIQTRKYLIHQKQKYLKKKKIEK